MDKRPAQLKALNKIRPLLVNMLMSGRFGKVTYINEYRNNGRPTITVETNAGNTWIEEPTEDEYARYFSAVEKEISKNTD